MKSVIIVIFLYIGSLGAFTKDTLFPVPENLKDNIEFWKIIYTKISLQEGLLHDRDYPLIIYDKLKIGTLYGKQLDNYTDKYKKPLLLLIKKVRTTDRATWGVEEKRIASLFKGYPSGALVDAENRIRFQVGQRERFLEGVIRSGAILDTIKAILDAYDIPSRLAYLPHVESSFDISAYSHAGAAGIWQFMPATGKEYLRINHIVDERRDPVLSTVAAAKLLSQNYRVLKSWPLAITAYNYGLSGIYSAVKKTGSRDLGVITVKHESPTFRFASKNFYSCFIAASEVAQNASNYFGDVQYMEKKGFGKEIELNVALYSFEISRMLGISEIDIAELNPSILPGVFKKQLQIPEGTKIRINNVPAAEKIEKQMVKFFKLYPKSEKRIIMAMRSSRTHSQQEETVHRAAIAEKNRNSVDSIYELNLDWPDQRYLHFFEDKLSGGGLAGSAFKIPESGQSGLSNKRDVSFKAAKKGSDIDVENKKTVPQATAYEPERLVIENRTVYKITVMVNETLGHYARWLEVSVSVIARLNKKQNGRIYVGEKLILPAGKDNIRKFTDNRMMYHAAQNRDRLKGVR
jgi:membrane-bound lytic murein transglycosylase D